MFYFVKTQWLIKKLYTECAWDVKTEEKIIHLAFDDGKDHTATAFAQEELKE